MTVSCPACGKEVPADTKFCVYCGNAMVETAHAARSPVSVEPLAASRSGVDADSNRSGFIMRLFGSTGGFVLLYALFMVPTYVLPYSGSNSAIVGAIGAAVGKGLMPATWAHLWFLASLILLAWMRGASIEKRFLPAISFCAALFDMTPMLSAIPFVPTIFHVVTLVIGVMGTAGVDSGSALPGMGRRAVTVLATMTVVAVGGSMLFMTSAGKGVRDLGNGVARQAEPPRSVKAPATRSVPQQLAPRPLASPTPAAAPASSAAPMAATPEPVKPVPAPVVASPTKPTSIAVSPKPADSAVPKRVAAQTQAAAANGNKTAITEMLNDANDCMASKRYECAITNARSVLRLNPANAEAVQLEKRANAAQSQALQSISIR